MKRLLKQTTEYAVNTEEEAKELMEAFRTNAKSQGYIVLSAGYTHKEKKKGGEILGTHEVVKLSAEYEKIWDDLEE